MPVPAGTYVVGAQASDPGAPGYDPLATGGELAAQNVSTPGFWIQKHEVTTASFRLCKDCMVHGVLEEQPGNLGLPDRMNHPVNGVSWHAAQAYCAFLGARLPTEVEWELHARGPDARRWPWGAFGRWRLPASLARPEYALRASLGRPECWRRGRFLVHLPACSGEMTKAPDPVGRRLRKIPKVLYTSKRNRQFSLYVNILIME